MQTPFISPLRALRERRGLSLAAVAEEVGIDRTQLSRIERSGDTSKETAEKLVRFFGPDQISEIEVLYPERFQEPKAA